MTHNQLQIPMDVINNLCERYREYNKIDPINFEKYRVKRGLRNSDGTGVVAGVSLICSVHGYIIKDRERTPDEGKLVYRGIDLMDIVEGCMSKDYFGFEEVIYLLLFGTLPTKKQYEDFVSLLASCRDLPDSFVEDMIMKAPSPNVMNKLARCVLALYSYDGNPDDTSIENVMRQSIMLISQMPTIMTYSYQVKRRYYDNKSMFLHPNNSSYFMSETILSSLRSDRKFTKDEARLLDLCLIIHAEHGGGNNSSFAARVLSSAGTDTYSSIASAIGSLKGPRHGGANIKVMEMLEYIKNGVSDYKDDSEIEAFLEKLIRREEGDKSGLIYGMGHAIYTKSDPRAVILKQELAKHVKDKRFEKDFHILDAVERLTPQVFARVKGNGKDICANVDLYSGLVYRVLNIPQDLFTPLFAIARMAGWCAHRLEELATGGRIIRPAYKSLVSNRPYIPIEDR